MADSPERQETRIVVELVSSADVKRLEERDDDLRAEIKRVEGLVEGLRNIFRDYLDSLPDRRR